MALFQDGTVDMASLDGFLDVDGWEPNDRLLLNVKEVGLVTAGVVIAVATLWFAMFGPVVVRKLYDDDAAVGDAGGIGAGLNDDCDEAKL